MFPLDPAVEGVVRSQGSFLACYDAGILTVYPDYRTDTKREWVLEV